MNERQSSALVSNSSSAAPEKWSLLAGIFNDSGPPATPSAMDVELLVGDGREDRVLLMGCTPSLRRKLNEVAPVLLSVDITPAMIDRSVRELAPGATELIVRGDWLRLPSPSGSVDRVVGDKVFGNILPEDWVSWLGEVRRVLRPGGVFATRCSPTGIESLDAGHVRFAKLVEEVLSKVDVDDDLAPACSLLWESALSTSRVFDGPDFGTLELSRVLPARAETLRQLADGGSTTALVNAFYERYWRSRYLRWSWYTERALVGVVEAAGFDLTSRLTANDYPEATLSPVFRFVAS